MSFLRLRTSPGHSAFHPLSEFGPGQGACCPQLGQDPGVRRGEKHWHKVSQEHKGNNHNVTILSRNTDIHVFKCSFVFDTSKHQTLKSTNNKKMRQHHWQCRANLLRSLLLLKLLEQFWTVRYRPKWSLQTGLAKPEIYIHATLFRRTPRLHIAESNNQMLQNQIGVWTWTPVFFKFLLQEPLARNEAAAPHKFRIHFGAWAVKMRGWTLQMLGPPLNAVPCCPRLLLEWDQPPNHPKPKLANEMCHCQYY